MKKGYIIALICLAVFAVFVIADGRNQEHIVHDFGVVDSFDQMLGHHYLPQYDIPLYAGWYKKDVSFIVEFEEPPVVICQCYQDSNDFRYYAGQLECEAKHITTTGFEGKCHYKIESTFRDEQENIYTPKNITMHWTAHEEADEAANITHWSLMR